MPLTGPSGPLVVLALLAGYVLCAWGLSRAAHRPRQVLAATGALLSGVLLGVSAVNAYFDYYRSWGALWSDLSSDNGTGTAPVVLPPRPGPARPPQPAPSTATGTPGTAGGSAPGAAAVVLSARPDPRPGRLVALSLPGAGAGLRHRQGLVWLPPQYGESAYRSVRFPVVVLLHGDPGLPSSWTHGLDVPRAMQAQTAAGSTAPVVVVMPDVRGRPDQQCLDAPDAPALDDYLSRDLPADLTRDLRVTAPGATWAVAGLSEGGFCAAHLALRHPGVYGAAGVMDGYFRPLPGTGAHRAAADPADDPTALLRALPAGAPVPAFWVMAGTGNPPDYRAAVRFALLLRQREDLRLVTVVHGRHTTPAWRAALPDLLHWAALQVTGHPTYGQLQLSP